MFGQSLDTSPKNSIFLESFDSEFPYIESWFADPNSKPLEIEDKKTLLYLWIKLQVIKVIRHLA